MILIVILMLSQDQGLIATAHKVRFSRTRPPPAPLPPFLARGEVTPPATGAHPLAPSQLCLRPACMEGARGAAWGPPSHRALPLGRGDGAISTETHFSGDGLRVEQIPCAAEGSWFGGLGVVLPVPLSPLVLPSPPRSTPFRRLA